MTVALDDLLVTPVRLSICGYLAGCDEADFKSVQEYCGMTQSNLSKQLTILSDRGYLVVRKVTVGRYARTRLQLTDAGRAALTGHIDYLQEIARVAQQATQKERE